MSQEARLMSIIRAPVVSEKSAGLADANRCYVFKVLKDATKSEVQAAVETIFKVKVQKVNTLNQQGKSRRTIHGTGKRSDFKKAYVTLQEGQTLDFSAEAEKESK